MADSLRAVYHCVRVHARALRGRMYVCMTRMRLLCSAPTLYLCWGNAEGGAADDASSSRPRFLCLLDFCAASSSASSRCESLSAEAWSLASR
jgi:hypothetical protein